MITPFKNVKDYIFDLDGTVWTIKELLPNADYVMDRIERKGSRIHFITNNTIHSREELSKRLHNLGIRAGKEHIYSSGYVAARYLEEKGIREAYVVGEHGLVSDISDSGIKVTENAPTVLVGIDRNFNYAKLKRSAELLNNGAELYCTGFSKYFKVGSDLFPGEAPFIRALETLTGKMPINIGKPSDIFKSRISEEMRLYPEEVLLVGDDLNEDMVFANNCGFKSALVLTGNTSKEAAEEASGLKKPGAVIRSLREIVSFF